MGTSIPDSISGVISYYTNHVYNFIHRNNAASLVSKSILMKSFISSIPAVELFRPEIHLLL
jgi:hypothetical protein